MRQPPRKDDDGSPLALGQRRPFSPFWTAGRDRAWTFVCAALIAFFCAFLIAWSGSTPPGQAAAFAAVVALVIGLVAALGGAWIRKRLLSLLEWWWWW